MSSWILILFQMLLPKFAKRLYLLLPQRPLLLLKLLPLLKPPLLPKPLLPMSLSPLAPMTRLPPNSPRNLNSPFKGGEDPTERAPLLEVQEVLPEDQAPSPSLAAFNKSFCMSYHGELLSVGFETTSVGSKTSKILTLWKSPVIVDETGGESSEQPGGAARDSEKGPHPTPEATPSSQGKASSGSTKKVTMQHFSKQGSFLFITFSRFSRFSNFDPKL
jgi:hypothetical protein